MTEMVDGSTPGTGIFGPSVDAFDQRVDELLEIVRSSKTAGRVFLAASRLPQLEPQQVANAHPKGLR